ncbi:MAG: RtcB family protein, partial [Bacteroidota bacterium]
WVLSQLKAVLDHPSDFLNSAEAWSRIAQALIDAEPTAPQELLPQAREHHIFGGAFIAESAKAQFDLALKLPISVKGALMPDAHYGYGLPIGGVLATDNAVIPYGVGMDIGCRMCLSVYAIKPSVLDRKTEDFKKLILDHTRFGHDRFDKPMDHVIFSRSEFQDIPKVKSLKNKAFQQIGSSGSGNHFVEFGIVNFGSEAYDLDLEPGQYLGLLSHSGSRGLGATIAQHYTNLAKAKSTLPKQALNLAWLDMDSEEGQEYWLAMNLAGDYASACHHQIHDRISQALGEHPINRIENHHNFAWKQKLANGQEVIVHRKGATPAGKGELGIIPGSMTAPGYIVRGRGFAQALASASHGAGRAMSRRQAKQSFTKKILRQELNEKGVSLMGGGLDEVPMAYKDIRQVMSAQQELVDILGSFIPKIVRMDE